MKLSRRLGLIVASAILGLIVVAGVALTTLRTTMLDERRNELRTVLILATQTVARFQALEQAGTLSHADAKARAIEALAAMRDGKAKYVWARTTDGLGLVLPNMKDTGRIDLGKMLPDGRHDFERYLDALKGNEFGYAEILVKKPGTDVELPKINGVTKVQGWNWVLGYGAWVDDIDNAFWRLAWRFIGLGVVVLIVVAVLAGLMARSIYRRIGGEPDYAAQVAREIAAGNLAQHLDVPKGSDSLLASVAHMQASLREMIDGIQRGATVLGHISSSLSRQMTRIDEASQLSSDATSSTAAAIEELSVSIDHISGSARETEDNSVHSSQVARDGEQMVQRAADTIQGVSQQVSQAACLIEGLLDRSSQIGGIASVIKEIADQTNLLALNAAIEAARAGEQGRGFAVVADEVRKLAERTTSATGQITTMVAAVQADTGSVVGSMQAITPLVGRGVDMATAAAASLREISAGAEATVAKVRDVAIATAEQSQAGTSVAQHVERIARMAEESAASVRAADEDVKRLETLASELRESVARFRL